MRRIGFVAVAALALVALAAPGVDARQGSNHKGHHQAATFTAKSTTAPQGGSLKVMAKVKHARHGASFSATATVHFASGDQTVQLKRHGKSFVATAKVDVSTDETPGTVPVDVTVSYDETDQEVETEGTVEDDQGDDQACDPSATTCGDDQGDGQDANNQGDDDQACDPATTTCDDNQGDDNQGDNPGTGD